MPLARIDLIKGKPSDYRRTIGDVVYKAMVEILKAPENDRFQVINESDSARSPSRSTSPSCSSRSLSTHTCPRALNRVAQKSRTRYLPLPA